MKIKSLKLNASFLPELCIAITAVAPGIRAQSLIEQIGWKGASGRIIMSAAAIVMSALALMTFLYVRARLSIKRSRKVASDDLFDEYVNKAGLYPSEVKLLKEILSHESVQYPHAVFQSAMLFEKCMDAEVRLLLASRGDPSMCADDEAVLSNLRKKLGYSYLPLEHPLLSTRNIETGQAVSVFAVTGSVPLVKRAVVVANRETSFRVQGDANDEEQPKFFEGEEVKLVFARQGDGVYGVQVEICRVDSTKTFECLHTMKFRRNQMRQFVRMEVNLPVNVRLVAPVQADNQSPAIGEQNEAMLSDISGGGVSFVGERAYVPGDVVSLRFVLTTGKFSGISGKVLRVSLIDGKTPVVYRHHIQFIDIEQKDRDRIVKFIFEKQRQQSQWR